MLLAEDRIEVPPAPIPGMTGWQPGHLHQRFGRPVKGRLAIYRQPRAPESLSPADDGSNQNGTGKPPLADKDGGRDQSEKNHAAA